MADRLYLSLWYPNFRLEGLPGALTAVLRQFAVLGDKRVRAASAFPINFTEAATYQRIYVEPPRTPNAEIESSPQETDAAIEAAVREATEQLHDDMAYEFEMRWQLWSPEQPSLGSVRSAPEIDEDPDSNQELETEDPKTDWKLRSHVVRVLGFGPEFDTAGYEQNGHILVDFGLDTPWTMDENLGEDELDASARLRIQQNIEKLLAFTLLVEKNCGISGRLLWTESGEPLAEKLIARLQRVN
jgi:hypothetical protein